MKAQPWNFLMLAAIALVIGCGAKPESKPADGKKESKEASAHPEAAPVKLTATGSSTVAPLISEIGKRYEAAHPGARIDVQTGGSSRGISDARQGLADIGMASRSSNPDETDLEFHPIALDGVCVILHQENPVAELSNERIVAIYKDEVNNWKELGGKDAPITVVNKAEGRSTLELFEKFFGIKNADIKADVIIGDNMQGIKTVAGNPDSIGYVSIGTAAHEVGLGTSIKLLPTNGIVPSIDTIKDKTFPISRSLNLVIKAGSSGPALDFIKFCQSKDVFDLVESLQFVPITE